MDKFKVKLAYDDQSIIDAIVFKTPDGYVCRVFDGTGYYETFSKKTKTAAKKLLFATKAFLRVKK